jgi:hypothetical protein
VKLAINFSIPGRSHRKHALFYATFHHSFAIAVVSAMDRTAFIEKHADRHRVVLSGAFR